MSRLKITLKSDLCSASGDGFSSLIDTDVSYDKFGFPYIGGRRLKGCLREAAELIGSPYIDEIFGVRGKAKSGSIKISDARLEDIEKLSAEAASNKKYNAESILSLFTYTRASTAIENDTAKDNSLRFTRVIKHYSPFDGNELVFFSDVVIDTEYENEFSDICKALRNIGYKHNRGFGAVKCEFIKEESSFPVCNINDDGSELQIEYTIRLDSNVMISGSSSDETIDFITGTSVLGLIANEYLKNVKADSRFEDIFLKNNVRFSNLYISDVGGRDYFPAPVIVGKVKGDSHYYNILRYDSGEETKIIKPLKSGYCDYDLNVISPVTETIYHHTNKDEATLYTQTSLCSNQYFKGTVTGKAEYIKEIYDILCRCDIRFGKSRSAQYSICRLVKSEVKKKEEKTIELKSTKNFIALAVSDILIPDEKGGYDISVHGFKKALGFADAELDKGFERKRSALRYRNIAGFNTKWNMQKPSVRAIAAGSTLVLTADKDVTLPEIKYIGAKQNEGFGKIMFIPVESLKEISAEKSEKEEKNNTENGKLYEYICRNKDIESMRTKAIEFFEKNKKNYSGDEIIKSQVGRYVMFVKQSDTYDALQELIKKDIVETEGHLKHRSSSVAVFDKIVKDSEADVYCENGLWKDYLLLILTLIKYVKRGETE